MPDIEAIADELATELKKHHADYLEAHLEEIQTSQITYRGKDLDSIGRSSSNGGNIFRPGRPPKVASIITSLASISILGYMTLTLLGSRSNSLIVDVTSTMRSAG